MKNVVAYCRVSTSNQAGEDKFGIDSQKEIIKGYCQGHDMVITDWYIDLGFSGADLDRPAIQELLTGEVKNPPVEAVVVAKSDRIARDVKAYYYCTYKFESFGMKIISASEDVVNDDTGIGEIYRTFLQYVAEQERKNITMRTSGGRRVKASRGGYSGGGAPYGYRVENHNLVIIPEEAEIVKKVFELKDGLGYTYQKVCDYFNTNGIPTRNGGKYQISTVQYIYERKKFYQGYYKYGKNDWVEGQHEAILPREES